MFKKTSTQSHFYPSVPVQSLHIPLQQNNSNSLSYQKYLKDRKNGKLSTGKENNYPNSYLSLKKQEMSKGSLTEASQVYDEPTLTKSGRVYQQNLQENKQELSSYRFPKNSIAQLVERNRNFIVPNHKKVYEGSLANHHHHKRFINQESCRNLPSKQKGLEFNRYKINQTRLSNFKTKYDFHLINESTSESQRTPFEHDFTFESLHSIDHEEYQQNTSSDMIIFDRTDSLFSKRRIMRDIHRNQQDQTHMKMQIISLKYQLEKFQNKYESLLTLYQSNKESTELSQCSPIRLQNKQPFQVSEQSIKIERDDRNKGILSLSSEKKRCYHKTHKRVNSSNEARNCYQKVDPETSDHCQSNSLKSQVKNLHSKLIEVRLQNLELNKKVQLLQMSNLGAQKVQPLKDQEKLIEQMSEKLKEEESKSILLKKEQEENLINLKQQILGILQEIGQKQNTREMGRTGDSHVEDMHQFIKILRNAYNDKNKELINLKEKLEQCRVDVTALAIKNKELRQSVSTAIQDYNIKISAKNREIQKLLEDYRTLLEKVSKQEQLQLIQKSQQQNRIIFTLKHRIHEFQDKIRDKQIQQRAAKLKLFELTTCYEEILSIFGIIELHQNLNTQEVGDKFQQIINKHETLLEEIKQFRQQMRLLVRKISANQKQSNQNEEINELYRQIDIMENEIDEKGHEIAQMRGIEQYQVKLIRGMEELIKKQNQEILKEKAKQYSQRIQKSQQEMSLEQSIVEGLIPFISHSELKIDSDQEQRLWKSGISYESDQP